MLIPGSKNFAIASE
jgi:hypothetical protein